MIARLTGTISYCANLNIIIDVNGVGYMVYCPASVKEGLPSGAKATLHTCTYIKEDRFDLFGFIEQSQQLLFQRLLKVNGIGPKMALEVCDVSPALLQEAAISSDASILQSIKGVGAKMAEKLLIEVKAMVNEPGFIAMQQSNGEPSANPHRQDVIDALTALGYDVPSILSALTETKQQSSPEETVREVLKVL
jgi:Holliday junction DNA helicase RuvA